MRDITHYMHTKQRRSCTSKERGIIEEDLERKLINRMVQASFVFAERPLQPALALWLF